MPRGSYICAQLHFISDPVCTISTLVLSGPAVICLALSLQILEEVERRREISPALVYPFMRSVMEAPFPAPGRTVTVKSFLPGSGNEVNVKAKDEMLIRSFVLPEHCRQSDSEWEVISGITTPSPALKG